MKNLSQKKNWELYMVKKKKKEKIAEERVFLLRLTRQIFRLKFYVALILVSKMEQSINRKPTYTC